MRQPARMSNWFKDWRVLDTPNRIAVIVLLPAALIAYPILRVQDWLATRRAS